MNSLNSVLIEGNLVADPESKPMEDGARLCSFRVASNRYFKADGDPKAEVSYFDVEVWNKTADRCMKALVKGSGVRVVGRMKQDRWADKDGRNHARVKIVGENVEIKPRLDCMSEDSQG